MFEVEHILLNYFSGPMKGKHENHFVAKLIKFKTPMHWKLSLIKYRNKGESTLGKRVGGD